MKIEKFKIKDLISPKYNPRQISDKEMEKLKRSIKEFNYIDPIIVNSFNNHIIGGNQRFEAMKQLGYDEIEVSVVNIPDPNKEKALNLRLNKLSGEWDTVKLNDIIQELEINHFDLSITGFDDFDEEIEFKTLLDKIEFEENNSQPKQSESIIDDEPIEEAVEVIEDEFEEPKKPLGYYNITLIFESEEEMTEAFDKLVSEGYNCRMSDS